MFEKISVGLTGGHKNRIKRMVGMRMVIMDDEHEGRRQRRTKQRKKKGKGDQRPRISWLVFANGMTDQKEEDI